MLSDSPDGRKYRFSAEYRQDVHMFVRKLRTSLTLLPESQELISFLWQKLLVITLIFGVIVFLLWSPYIFSETLSYGTTEGYSIKNLMNNTNEKSSQRRQTFFVSIEQRNVPNYCQLSSCKTISCSSILKGTDPGTVASSFIENDFKVHCENAISVSLSFDNCIFPENTLRRNWLCTNVSIEELTFNSCSLSEIEDDAFSSSIYERTEKVSMVNNTLVSLRKAMFRCLKNLRYLAIQRNFIKLAELNLLEDLASLTILELDEVINDRKVLRNITGANDLSSLQILSLRSNAIPMIDAELFAGLSAVKSLYLENSKIETVSSDVLQPIVSSIWQLTLNGNKIASLPQGLRDSILIASSKQPFKLVLNNNPWHCDCNLKWMQDLVLSRPNISITVPICKTPPINADKPFTSAEFCCQSNSTASTMSVTHFESTRPNWNQDNQTSTQKPANNNGTVNIICYTAYTLLHTAGSRKLLSSDSLQLRPRFPNFYASNTPNEDIIVYLPDRNGVTLVWFDNNDVDSSLRCVKNVKYSYLLGDIDPQTVYTICLLDDNEETVSPLNCLAVATNPRYEYRTWLINKDKTLVLAVSIVSLVVQFLIGSFLSFLLIRRYPTLICGNKRVMLVKHRNVDAIVLPKGVNIDEKEQSQGKMNSYSSKLHEDDYVTPLPPERIPRPRRSRKISVQSDRNSYVSEIDMTESQLTSWGLMRLMSELENEKSDAPPLPPHRCNAVPSLSLAVDSKDDNEYQTFIV